MDYGDTWTVAEGERNDLPMVIRFRQLKDPLNFFEKFPHRLCIEWNFLQGTELGLPTPNDSAELSYFQEVIRNTLEAEDIAILVLVITNDNCRDFYMYTADTDAFLARFHSMPQRRDPYPVDMSVKNEEGGEFYRNVVANSKESIQEQRTRDGVNT